MQTPLSHAESFEGRSSTELALGCFALGTIYFIICLTQWDPIFVLTTGFIFVVLATILNGMMLYYLLHHFYVLPQKRKYIIRKITIMLANVPIAILYFIIINYFGSINQPF